MISIILYDFTELSYNDYEKYKIKFVRLKKLESL